MLHLDVKEAGQIPTEAAGGLTAAAGAMRQLASAPTSSGVGCTYLHSAVDGFSHLACTEALEDETAVTRSGSPAALVRTSLLTGARRDR